MCIGDRVLVCVCGAKRQLELSSKGKRARASISTLERALGNV